MARIHITIEKSLNDHGNDGVGTHLEQDILECEVKWALAKLTTNKASGGDEISLELIKILKDSAVKVLHLMYQQIKKKLTCGHRTGKGQCSFQFKRRAMRKNVQTTVNLYSLL